MSLTYQQANDEILTMFKAAWDPTGHEAFYDAVRKQREADNSAWAVVTLNHIFAQQDSLGGIGGRSFKREGTLIITLNTPSTSGLSEAYTLGKVLVDAYEGISSPGGVWFRNVRINELGRDGAFNQTNVLVDFEYYEVK
tara:strand:+ start:10083 stop:10499 length:417 start_codon:yes stop_codon:yes gene_type:complete